MTHNTESVKLSVSRGNTKMGAIPSVSLPPIVTCPAGCPCAKRCYAAKICRLRPSVRNAYQRNLGLLQADPDSYWAQIRDSVKMLRYFRFHVSGDIPTADYFAEMVETARQNPHCEILAFSKQYFIVNEWIDKNGDLPDNLHIIFSEWGSNWAVNNPHNLPTSAVIFKGDDAEKYDKICPGNCFECATRGRGCWTLGKGETIAFHEH